MRVVAGVTQLCVNASDKVVRDRMLKHLRFFVDFIPGVAQFGVQEALN